MATPSSTSAPVGPETSISIKISVNSTQKKFKLPLADLVPGILPGKLRAFLGVSDNQVALFERFSDSSASYVNLDPNNHQAYKTLYRAAKAKLKLRLRATLGPDPIISETVHGLSNLNFGSQTSLDPHPPSYVIPGNTVSMKYPATPVWTQPPPITFADVTTTASAISASTQFPVTPDPISKTAVDVVMKAEKTSARESELLSRFGHLELNSAGNCNRQLVCPYSQNIKPLVETIPMPDPPNLPAGATYSWSVYCNSCEKPMLDEHFHCNICELGDYDLCTDCVGKGKHCLDENHWLIKRFLSGTKVMNSTTETVARDVKGEIVPKRMPGAFTEEKKTEEAEKPTRTCNCCVKVFPEDDFVTCGDCEDYDLCVPCLEAGKHGHHPGHRFEAATAVTVLSATARALCNSGRNVKHEAICDECNERIVGVRHKCLICPDWDYCSTCVQKSSTIHSGHRFAPVYDLIPTRVAASGQLHVGVYCDGPLCKNKNTYIAGVRYKCAICGDVDFCANCEAHPSLKHNRTHPLLKFRSPVRGCKVTMMQPEEDLINTATVEATSTATQIRTVAEVKPTVAKSLDRKLRIKDLLVDDEANKMIATVDVKDANNNALPKVDGLQAYFIRDTISDGTALPPQQTFVQVWTLKNPGPDVWPAGCSVRYVGGDNMLNVDDVRPFSSGDISRATESNVIRRAVQVDEEISFRVLMKAPQREGVAISYWRLKAADGKPFGHRLWCHINVRGFAPEPAKDEYRELGRLGSHDTFLRHTLNEKLAAKNDDLSEGINTIRDALEKTQKLHANVDRSRRIKQMMRTRQMSDKDLVSEQLNNPEIIHERLQQRLASLQKDLAARKQDSRGRAHIHQAMERAIREEVARLSPKPCKDKISPTETGSPCDIDAAFGLGQYNDAKLEKDMESLLFPKLEKESPNSSTHEKQTVTNAATTENVPAVALSVPAATSPAPSHDADLFDDAESVSLVNASDDSDSGFLTEDEYDILDASDEDAN